MARRTKAEALATREQIMDAAEAVFHRLGVSRATLSDIATEAGVTRGAIYWHFKNKQDVFNAMIERVTLPLESLAEQQADPATQDPLGSYRAFLLAMLTDMASDTQRRRAFEVVFQKCEMTEENRDILERHREAMQRGTERAERILNNAVHQGQLPSGLDTRQAAIVLHCQITGLISHWLLDPEHVNLAANTRFFLDFYFDSLAQCRPPSAAHA